MQVRNLIILAVLAIGVAGSTRSAPAAQGAPKSERTVLYWMPDYQLLPARIRAETWRASGVTALLVPSFGFEVVDAPLPDARIQAHLDEVTDAADGMPVYLGVTLSYQAENPRGGEIPYPWGDSEQWSHLDDNLRRLAAECERRGVRGILLDGEGYGQSPGSPFSYQDPRYCYRAPARGERGLPRKRGAELARALRDGGPSLTLGTYFGHGQEAGTPSCRPFWRGFFNAAGRNALFIYEDSYGAFPGFRFTRFSQAMRTYYQCPRAVPAWWAGTGAADVPGWFRRAQPQLQAAMDATGMLMVYQDQQGSAPPGVFFSPDPVWSAALAEVLRSVRGLPVSGASVPASWLSHRRATPLLWGSAAPLRGVDAGGGDIRGTLHGRRGCGLPRSSSSRRAEARVRYSGRCSSRCRIWRTRWMRGFPPVTTAHAQPWASASSTSAITKRIPRLSINRMPSTWIISRSGW